MLANCFTNSLLKIHSSLLTVCKPSLFCGAVYTPVEVVKIKVDGVALSKELTIDQQHFKMVIKLALMENKCGDLFFPH